MSIRTVGMVAPFRWLMKALDVGGRNPRAVFGAIALMLAVVIAMSLGQMAMQAAAHASTNALIAVYVVVSLISWVLMPPLFGGVFRVLDAADRGAPTRAAEVFDTFSRGNGARRMILTAMSYSLFYVGFLALVAMTPVGQFYREYFAIAMSMPPGGEPDTAAILALFGRAPAGLLLWSLLIALALTVWTHAYMFGIAHAALRDEGVAGSVTAGAMAALRNFLPLLGFVLALAIGGFVVVLLLGVVLGLLIGGLSLISPVLGILVMLPVLVLLMLGIYALLFGFYYHGWREVFGAGSPPAPTAPQDVVEV